jgi:general stress protein 26
MRKFGASLVFLGGTFAGGLWVGKEYGHLIDVPYVKIRNRIMGLKREEKGIDFALSLAKNGGKYAVLSTSNSETIHSRIIEPHSIDYDENLSQHVIYFNTSSFSRKCHEMKTNPEVSLTYVNFNTLSYVTFSGKVERVPFPESTNYWQSHLTIHYPEGNDEQQGSRFSTWKIVPHTISFVDLSQGTISTRKDFRAPEIQFQKEDKRWVVVCDGQGGEREE